MDQEELHNSSTLIRRLGDSASVRSLHERSVSFTGTNDEPGEASKDDVYECPKMMSIWCIQDTYANVDPADLALHLTKLSLNRIHGIRMSQDSNIVKTVDGSTSTNDPNDTEENETFEQLNLLPVNIQLGLHMLLKTLKAINVESNMSALNAILETIPNSLANMPPLALISDPTYAREVLIDAKLQELQLNEQSLLNNFQKRKARIRRKQELEVTGTPTCTMHAGIPNILWRVFEGAYNGHQKNETVTAGRLLSALVGLSVKEGSLNHILGCITVLLQHAEKLQILGGGGGLKSPSFIASPSPAESNNQLSPNAITHISGGGGGNSQDHRNDGNSILELQDEDEDLNVESYMKELHNASVHDWVQRIQAEEDSEIVGQLYTFGKGDHGKLGHGKCEDLDDRSRLHEHCPEGNCTENIKAPKLVQALGKLDIAKVASLSTHSVALTSDGLLYTWGNGDKHRLGHGTTSKEFTPKLVATLLPKPRVVDVSCGLGHTMVLLADSSIWTWGNGGNGRLGLGDTDDRALATAVTRCVLENHAAPVNTSNIHFVAVACGASHSAAITDSGTCFMWGKNNQGQCGLGDTVDKLLPQRLESLENVILVAGGWEHTLLLTNANHYQQSASGVNQTPNTNTTSNDTNGDGNPHPGSAGILWSCGGGYKDARRNGVPPVLGHGGSERELVPRQVQGIEQVAYCACGWDHSMAVNASGEVFSWGAGTNGKLGHGDETSRTYPTKIEAFGLLGVHVSRVEAGCEHSVAVTDEGYLYTWGHGDSGRLGHGSNRTEKRPKRVEALVELELPVVSIAVGDKYNMVLVEPVNGGSAKSITSEASMQRMDLSIACYRSEDVIDREMLYLPKDEEEFTPEWLLAAGKVGVYMCLQLDRLATDVIEMKNLILNRTADNSDNARDQTDTHMNVMVIPGYLECSSTKGLNTEFGSSMPSAPTQSADQESPDQSNTSLKSGAKSGIETPRTNTFMLPYCVELKPETFHRIVNLLQFCLSRIKRFETQNSQDSIATAYESHQAEMYWIVIRSLLQVLKANLLILSKIETRGDATGNLMSMHKVLLEIISKNQVDASTAKADAILEAAEAIQLGFIRFYPTAKSRVDLLTSLLDSQNGDTKQKQGSSLGHFLSNSPSVLEVLMSNLARDESMRDLVQGMRDGYVKVDTLMQDLLHTLDRPFHSTLLLSLQTHLFSQWDASENKFQLRETILNYCTDVFESTAKRIESSVCDEFMKTILPALFSCLCVCTPITDEMITKLALPVRDLCYTMLSKLGDTSVIQFPMSLLARLHSRFACLGSFSSIFRAQPKTLDFVARNTWVLQAQVTEPIAYVTGLIFDDHSALSFHQRILKSLGHSEIDEQRDRFIRAACALWIHSCNENEQEEMKRLFETASSSNEVPINELLSDGYNAVLQLAREMNEHGIQVATTNCEILLGERISIAKSGKLEKVIGSLQNLQLDDELYELIHHRSNHSIGNSLKAIRELLSLCREAHEKGHSDLITQFVTYLPFVVEFGHAHVYGNPDNIFVVPLKIEHVRLNNGISPLVGVALEDIIPVLCEFATIDSHGMSLVLISMVLESGIRFGQDLKTLSCSGILVNTLCKILTRDHGMTGPRKHPSTIVVDCSWQILRKYLDDLIDAPGILTKICEMVSRECSWIADEMHKSHQHSNKMDDILHNSACITNRLGAFRIPESEHLDVSQLEESSATSGRGRHEFAMSEDEAVVAYEFDVEKILSNKDDGFDVEQRNMTPPEEISAKCFSVSFNLCLDELPVATRDYCVNIASRCQRREESCTDYKISHPMLKSCDAAHGIVCHPVILLRNMTNGKLFLDVAISTISLCDSRRITMIEHASVELDRSCIGKWISVAIVVNMVLPDLTAKRTLSIYTNGVRAASVDLLGQVLRKCSTLVPFRIGSCNESKEFMVAAQEACVSEDCLLHIFTETLRLGAPGRLSDFIWHSKALNEEEVSTLAEAHQSFEKNEQKRAAVEIYAREILYLVNLLIQKSPVPYDSEGWLPHLFRMLRFSRWHHVQEAATQLMTRICKLCRRGIELIEDVIVEETRRCEGDHFTRDILTLTPISRDDGCVFLDYISNFFEDIGSQRALCNAACANCGSKLVDCSYMALPCTGYNPYRRHHTFASYCAILRVRSGSKSGGVALKSCAVCRLRSATLGSHYAPEWQHRNLLRENLVTFLRENNIGEKNAKRLMLNHRLYLDYLGMCIENIKVGDEVRMPGFLRGAQILDLTCPMILLRTFCLQRHHKVGSIQARAFASECDMPLCDFYIPDDAAVVAIRVASKRGVVKKKRISSLESTEGSNGPSMDSIGSIWDQECRKLLNISGLEQSELILLQDIDFERFCTMECNSIVSTPHHRANQPLITPPTEGVSASSSMDDYVAKIRTGESSGIQWRTRSDLRRISNFLPDSNDHLIHMLCSMVTYKHRVAAAKDHVTGRWNLHQFKNTLSALTKLLVADTGRFHWEATSVDWKKIFNELLSTSLQNVIQVVRDLGKFQVSLIDSNDAALAIIQKLQSSGNIRSTTVEWLSNRAWDRLEFETTDRIIPCDAKESARCAVTHVYTFEAVQGEIRCDYESGRITSISKSSLIRVTGKHHPLQLRQGVWYFEITIESAANPIISFADQVFENSSTMLGSDEHSWAFSVMDASVRHRGIDSSFGTKMSVGDVVGCCIDMDNNSVRFLRNNVDLGIAFSDMKPQNFVYPLVMISGNEQIKIEMSNFQFAVPRNSKPLTGAFSVGNHQSHGEIGANSNAKPIPRTRSTSWARKLDSPEVKYQHTVKLFLAHNLSEDMLYKAIVHFEAQGRALNELDAAVLLQWARDETTSAPSGKEPMNCFGRPRGGSNGSLDYSEYEWSIVADEHGSAAAARDTSRVSEWIENFGTSLCRGEPEALSLLYIVDNCRSEELPVIVSILEAVSCTHLSRAVLSGVLQILHKHDISMLIGCVEESPESVVQFIEFLQLILLRGSTTDQFAMTGLPMTSPSAHPNILMRDILHHYFRHLAKDVKSSLLATTLIKICVRSFEHASSNHFDNVKWGCTPLSLVCLGEHRSYCTFSDPRSLYCTLSNAYHGPPYVTLSDREALCLPNLEWVNLVLDTLDVEQGGSNTPSWHDDFYSSGCLHHLLGMTKSTNVHFRTNILNVCTRMLTSLRSRVMSQSLNSSSEGTHWSEVSDMCRTFTLHFRRESSQEAEHTPYLKAVTGFLVAIRRFREASLPQEIVNIPAKISKYRSPAEKLLELYITHVGSTSVAMMWSDKIASQITSVWADNASTEPVTRLEQPDETDTGVFDDHRSRSGSGTDDDFCGQGNRAYTLILEYRVRIGPTNVLHSIEDIVDQFDDHVLLHEAVGAEPWKTLFEKPVDSKMSHYTCEGLESDTPYEFRLGMHRTNNDGHSINAYRWGPSRWVDSQVTSLFRFSSVACGPNLQVSHDGVSVTNSVNKRWNLVRTSTGFRSGVHLWDAVIDKCTSKNIFIGIVTAGASSENYVGADKFGWGYLANKAVWHAKGKVKTYGELFREGDVITVKLDLDAGTLSFSRNGHDMGVGFEDLGSFDEYFPAVSLYNIGDQVSIRRSSTNVDVEVDSSLQNNNHGGKNTQSAGENLSTEARMFQGTAFANAKIGRIAEVLDILEYMRDRKNSTHSFPGNLPFRTLQRISALLDLHQQRAINLENRTIKFADHHGSVDTVPGTLIRNDVPYVESPWGQRKLLFEEGEAHIEGICNGRLYYKLPASEVKGFLNGVCDNFPKNAFSLRSKTLCMEYRSPKLMLPTVLIPWSSESGGTLIPVAVQDTNQGSLANFKNVHSGKLSDEYFALTSTSHSQWSTEADKQLVESVDVYCRSKRQSFDQINLVTFEVMNLPSYPDLALKSPVEIRQRLAMMVYLNLLLVEVWDMIDFTLPAAGFDNNLNRMGMLWTPGQSVAACSEIAVFTETKLIGIYSPLKSTSLMSRSSKHNFKTLSFHGDSPILLQLASINMKSFPYQLSIEFQETSKGLLVGQSAVQAMSTKASQEMMSWIDNEKQISDEALIGFGCLIGIAFITGCKLPKNLADMSSNWLDIMSSRCIGSDAIARSLVRSGVDRFVSVPSLQIFSSMKILQKFIFTN